MFKNPIGSITMDKLELREYYLEECCTTVRLSYYLGMKGIITVAQLLQAVPQIYNTLGPISAREALDIIDDFHMKA